MNLSMNDDSLLPVIPANAGTHLDLVAGLLILAVMLSCTRLLWWQHKAPAQSRSRVWRLALLLALQPICATLLYFTLLPPTLPIEAGTLVVATAQSTSTQLVQQHGDSLIALPESPALA